MCPVCGKHEFPERSSYDICPYCGWEDGLLWDDPDEPDGANGISLNEAKSLWNEYHDNVFEHLD